MTIALSIIAVILALFILWRIYFLRDPQRQSPTGNVVLAPADGYVVYVKEIRNGEVPVAIKQQRRIPLTEITEVEEFSNCNGLLIGTFMTPFSVHRNRAPVAGTVSVKKYYKNQVNLSMIRTFVEALFHFKRFRDEPFYLSNERLTLGFDTDRGRVFVTQIADEWINRILTWVDMGEQVDRGQQYGMIRFGSQCDLFIPDSYGLEVQVKVGQYVHAGQTILGTYTDPTDG